MLAISMVYIHLIFTLMEALRENPREIRMFRRSSFGWNAPSEPGSILLC